MLLQAAACSCTSCYRHGDLRPRSLRPRNIQACQRMHAVGMKRWLRGDLPAEGAVSNGRKFETR